MLNLVKNKIPLAVRFHLTLVVPLVLVSIAVSTMTFRGLQNNASHLAEVLRIEAKTNRILSLLLLQDDASKAMLIDPNQLEIFSARKIEAYDAHKALLIELQKEAGAGRFQELIQKLQEIDEQKLRPVDSLVLEKLYEDVDAARRMYFEQYEVHKEEYEALMHELAAIGAEDLRKASQEMHDRNVSSHVQISLTLLLGILVIAVTITILSRQVEKSDRNTRSLLAVLSEGLFFFDQDGRIAAERSQSLAAILPESVGIESLHDFLQRYAPGSQKNVALCLQMLWGDNDPNFFSEIETSLSLLPRALTLADQRVIHLEYRPLRNAKGRLNRVVVVVADVTQNLQQEKEVRFQTERVKKISRAAARLEDYLSFLDESRNLFKNAARHLQQPPRPIDAASLHQLKRDLHTLKGNLASADFTYLAAQLHQLESLMEERGPADPGVLELWNGIERDWTLETDDIERVLGLNQKTERLQLSRAKWERIQKHALAIQDKELQDILVTCLRQPPAEIFGRYADYLQTTAEKLEKKVRLRFTDDSAELALFEVQKMDAVFNHILRNCLDHGIESPERRVELGKPAEGTIQWSLYRKADDALQVILQDDGQGVDAATLAAKAVQKGYWTEAQARVASEQEKVDLLFLPQLSTRDTVTELSGRGVGMDAVKELLQELGGTIRVLSTVGVGTRFEIEIPSQLMPVDWLRRSA